MGSEDAEGPEEGDGDGGGEAGVRNKLTSPLSAQAEVSVQREERYRRKWDGHHPFYAVSFAEPFDGIERDASVPLQYDERQLCFVVTM